MPNAKAKIPAPISWAASQWWDGDDGRWSSFDVRVGNPEQTIRVLPSTAGPATWIVTPGGCRSPNCSVTRGGLFNPNQSSTWQDLGPFTLALEQNLGHNESGAFGLDTISLGLTNATGGSTLGSQIIARIETEHWYIGLLGLQQQPMNLTGFSEPHRSVLSTLRAQSLTPSLSWYRLTPTGLYLITDYDNKNFTLAQTSFNDSAKPEIIPMPWNATISPGRDDCLSRSSIIGVSIGSIVTFILISILVVYLTKRWRRSRAEKGRKEAKRTKSSDTVRPLSFIPAQEIGSQSLQEVHAISHHLELLDGQALPGSGNAMNELYGRGEPHCELPASPDQESEASSSTLRGVSSSKPTESDEVLSTSRFTRILDTSNLMLRPDPLRSNLTARDNVIIQDPKRRVIKHSYRAEPSLAKALPPTPITETENSKEYSPYLTVPVAATLNAPEKKTAAHHVMQHPVQGNGVMAVTPGTTHEATYATIFDIEEYKGKAKAKAKER